VGEGKTAARLQRAVATFVPFRAKNLGALFTGLRCRCGLLPCAPATSRPPPVPPSALVYSASVASRGAPSQLRSSP